MTKTDTPNENGSEIRPTGTAAGAAAAHPHFHRKHHARIEHSIRGRIRIKVPHGRVNPDILEVYRETFAGIPGTHSIETNPETGSIIIHYDPNRDVEFNRHFDDACDQHLAMVPVARPGDEIDKIADEIAAEAEFLAEHSK
jgi:hypothetical protein